MLHVVVHGTHAEVASLSLILGEARPIDKLSLVVERVVHRVGILETILFALRKLNEIARNRFLVRRFRLVELHGTLARLNHWLEAILQVDHLSILVAHVDSGYVIGAEVCAHGNW